MARKVLLFGHTGKMGTALARELAGDEVTGVNSTDLDVADFDAVRALVERAAPDIVINTVARLGIDDCERNPAATFRVNALFPRRLAEMSAERGFVLVQFSTETVFSGEAGRELTEDDPPDPVNAYGFGKYMAELAVRDAAPRHYVFRLPVLFGAGAKRAQFVERMVDRARAGKPLRVADDIVTTPTYAVDAAAAAVRALNEERPFGLFHLANAERGSLFDLVAETVRRLGLGVRVERASYRDFPSLGRKNTMTPLKMSRLPALRPWREALADYCREIGD